jgi:hypothetical protein
MSIFVLTLVLRVGLGEGGREVPLLDDRRSCGPGACPAGQASDPGGTGMTWRHRAVLAD